MIGVGTERGLGYGYDSTMIICDVLRNFEPFVLFKKREKHPWRSATFSKVAGF